MVAKQLTEMGLDHLACGLSVVSGQCVKYKVRIIRVSQLSAHSPPLLARLMESTL
jgi:hypothetical protein